MPFDEGVEFQRRTIEEVQHRDPGGGYWAWESFNGAIFEPVIIGGKLRFTRSMTGEPGNNYKYRPCELLQYKLRRLA